MVVECQLPPEELSPNRYGVHRMVKAAAVRRYRADCCLMFLGWRNRQKEKGRFERAELQLEFYMAPAQVPDGLARFRDRDNADASCKALQDALVDARIIAGDDSRRLIRLPSLLYRNAREHQGRRCVVVTLREITSEEHL